MQNYANFLYWIRERENVRLKKEAGAPKPWSGDPVFQSVYFCNVHREHDKVTKWIREFYSPYVHEPMFEFNIVLARFLNWPPTLEYLDYIENDVDYDCIGPMLKDLRDTGVKIWGNAYVVTTHGIPMDKIDYLCDRVLPSAVDVLPLTDQLTCSAVATYLQNIEGISTFMAGQVVADLKNTPGHPLADAPDWNSFALPGPVSRRGMDWLHATHIPEGKWLEELHVLQHRLATDGIILCAQDVQNCLCEFDKYCRVTTGTGRSKRRYNGT